MAKLIGVFIGFFSFLVLWLGCFFGYSACIYRWGCTPCFLASLYTHLCSNIGLDQTKRSSCTLFLERRGVGIEHWAGPLGPDPTKYLTEH